MATNVPSIVWGATGPIAPSGPAILAGVQQDYNIAYNVTFNFNLNTPQGQLSSSLASVVNNANQLIVYYVNQIDPAFSTGRMQDAIGRISFQTRLPSVPTTLQIVCIGAENVPIPAGPVFGTVVDSANNLYQCTQPATIPVGGTIILSFAAVVPGPTPVPETVKIYQAIPGWDSATVLSGVVGQNVESSQQFELRRQQSIAKNAVNSNNAILGAVLDVAGVLDAYVIDNPSAAPVTIRSFTLAAKSVYVAASGGAPSDVAAAIMRKKPPGTPMNGNTSVIVEDQNPAYSPPFPKYTIIYEIPPTLPIYFFVNLVNNLSIPADATAQIQTAIINAFNGTTVSTSSNNPSPPRARIGSDIFATQYAGVIALLGSWAQVRSIQVGSANTPDAVALGHIIGTTMTITSVSSGAFAVGAYVTGGDNLTSIADATIVTIGSGGAGSYTVNILQNVGATFTGTGSGTNLTASAVTGSIGIGDTVVGTGVPANTTIVSQTSGPAGGAGVYVTNNATTSSGNALSANIAIKAASADQNVVSVGIAQEPTITANNIVVVLT